MAFRSRFPLGCEGVPQFSARVAVLDVDAIHRARHCECVPRLQITRASAVPLSPSQTDRRSDSVHSESKGRTTAAAGQWLPLAGTGPWPE